VIAASRGDLADLRRRAYERSERFGYENAAATLLGVYRSL